LPRKKKLEVDSKIKEKLEYIGLDLDKIPKSLKEYSDINFRTLRGYDEKKYKQYRFVNVSDIEILLSPTNRINTIKEKYEKAMPLCFFLDSKNEENFLNFTEFLNMLNKVSIPQIEEIESEQKMLSKEIPFKVKFTGNYLWQIYYSEISNKYFMIVPIEDTDYSTFFYILKRKIENKKNDKVFVPISLVDYEGAILKKEEIKDLENYLWLFTKDYPTIYEVWNKKDEVSLNIVGETELFDNIKTLYKVKLENQKEASKFYKLVKALFILQTELPRYYKFETNINEEGSLEFYLDNSNIKYKILPEFIMQQYLKSVSLKNKTMDDLEEFDAKLDVLKKESKELEAEYMSKEKQITTFLECKKTFFGKVKYFFKFGKKTQNGKVLTKKAKTKEEKKPQKEAHKKEKFKMEQKNYTLYELEQSFKELEKREDEVNNIVMDINALKLKNKNLRKKIENASSYIEEINKHKKSIFEFWKYSNKDAVATLDEGEEEEFNVKKIEKIFNYEDDFEDFGLEADKLQRSKLTDSELDSSYVASTDILPLLNRMNLKISQNREISEKLKKMKLARAKGEDIEDDDDDIFNIFGRLRQTNNKERTIGNKTHREQPRDRMEILGVKKETKGIELKRSLESVIKDLKTAIRKNSLKEDMYVYKASSEKLEFNTFEDVSLNSEEELNNFLKEEKNVDKIYLYKIKLPKDTNYIAFTNIIFFDNKNMTLPLGMNLSSRILVDLSNLTISEEKTRKLNKLQFEEEDYDFSNIIIKNISLNEVK
jgi:hypothetical protein